MKDPELVLEDRVIKETNRAVFWLAGIIIASFVYWKTNGNILISVMSCIFGVVICRWIFLAVRLWFARKRLRRHL